MSTHTLTLCSSRCRLYKCSTGLYDATDIFRKCRTNNEQRADGQLRGWPNNPHHDLHGTHFSTRHPHTTAATLLHRGLRAELSGLSPCRVALQGSPYCIPRVRLAAGDRHTPPRHTPLHGLKVMGLKQSLCSGVVGRSNTLAGLAPKPRAARAAHMPSGCSRCAALLQDCSTVGIPGAACRPLLPSQTVTPPCPHACRWVAAPGLANALPHAQMAGTQALSTQACA